jgi:LPS export ABC transporter protein LptC
MLAACNPKPGRAPSPVPSARNRLPWLHVTQSGTARQPLELVEQRGNRRQYMLIANSEESSGAGGTTVGTWFDARVTFYERDGRKLFARARRAVVNQRDDTLTLIGNVQARTDSGTTLTCGRLRYDQRTDRIHGQDHVVITNAKGLRATGDRVDSNLALSQAVLR